MFQIWASELGLRSDRLTFTGASPVDVVAQVVAYLEIEYGIRLPEAHMIFREGDSVRWVLSATGVEGSQRSEAPDNSPPLYAVVIQHLRHGVPIHLS